MKVNDNPVKYKLQILKMGQCQVRGPEVFWMDHWDDWVDLYFYMVVIRGNGQTVVINTGPPRDLTELNARWTGTFGARGALVRAESERPDAALRAIGIDPAAVQLVLITPLQAYATANIPLFRNARIGISRRGWIEDFQAPICEMHVPRRLRIPDDALHYLTLDAPEKLRLLDDEEQVSPGIRAVWVGAHHRSSMAFLVDTAQGCVAITDCCFKYENIEKMHPLGIMESLPECLAAYDRLRREADHIIPLYDPAVLDRFPGGKVG